MKSPGLISSLKEPTAEKAIMTRTPRDFRAAMLARTGMKDGAMLCCFPCLAKNAMWVPSLNLAMVIGELGNPQG